MSSLLSIQVAFTLLTLAAYGLFIGFYAHSKIDINEANQRAVALKVISPEIDGLRAWAELGAKEPLSATISVLESKLKPLSIDVKSLSGLEHREISKNRSILVLPEKYDNVSSFYILSQIPKASVWDSLGAARPYALTVTLFLFISLISTCIFVYRFLFLPIQRIVKGENLHILLQNSSLANSEIGKLIITTLSYERARNIAEIEAQKSALAIQIAHDIRSPLAAIRAMSHGIDQKSSGSDRILSSAITRISQITDDLLKLNKSSTSSDILDSNGSVVIYSIESIVSETKSNQNTISKRIQFSNQNKLIGIHNFLSIPSATLNRILSILLTNATEATSQDSCVVIRAIAINDRIQIIVEDSGAGFTKEFFQKVGTPQYTTKSNGNGLGLPYVINTLKMYGATIEFSNNPGGGGVVTLNFPVALDPIYSGTIRAFRGDRILILDDDVSLASALQLRLQKHGFEVFVCHSPSDLPPDSATKFDLAITDFDLGQGQLNGIEVLKSGKLPSNTVLMTSNFESAGLQTQAGALSIKILPKILIPHLEVVVLDRLDTTHVLIDDDQLIRQVWEMQAKKRGIKLTTLSCPKELEPIVDHIPKNAEIYLDMNLGEDISGLTIAKDLAGRGFKNLYLQTGYEASTITKPEYVLAVLGKAPPF